METRGNKGFTLVEVLVAFILMAIGMIALWGLHISSLEVDMKNKFESGALDLAGRKIEELRNPQLTSFKNIRSGRIDAGLPKPYNFVEWIVTPDVEIPPAPNEWRKSVRVNVGWAQRVKDIGGNHILDNKSISLNTIITDQ